MSIKHMTHVWETAPVTGTSLLVLLALADFANHNGESWPSIKVLAERARTSVRTVQRCLDELQQRGLIEAEQRIGRASRYRVRLDSDPRQSDTPPLAPDEPEPTPEPAPPCHPTPDTAMSPHPRHSYVTPTTLNPQGTPKEPPPPADAGAQALVGEWLDGCAKRPPGQVIAQIGKHVKAMLGEGIDPTDIRRGLVGWQSKRLHPSTLPSVVHELMNSPAQGRTLADKSLDWLRLAQDIQELPEAAV